MKNNKIRKKLYAKLSEAKKFKEGPKKFNFGDSKPKVRGARGLVAPLDPHLDSRNFNIKLITQQSRFLLVNCCNWFTMYSCKFHNITIRCFISQLYLQNKFLCCKVKTEKLFSIYKPDQWRETRQLAKNGFLLG